MSALCLCQCSFLQVWCCPRGDCWRCCTRPSTSSETAAPSTTPDWTMTRGPSAFSMITCVASEFSKSSCSRPTRKSSRCGFKGGYGQRSFCYAALSVWNCLPYKVRSSATLPSFRSSEISPLQAILLIVCAHTRRCTLMEVCFDCFGSL